MPLTRAEKETVVQQLHEEFGGTRNLVVLDFRGLKVAEVDDFRRKVRQSRSTYKVVKNTLALRALEGTEAEPLKAHFDGPTAIAFNPESLVGLAKVIQSFRADHEALRVKAAWLDGKVLDTKALDEIAKLPGLQELRAQVLGLLVSPLRGFAQVLAAAPREMAVVISERVKQRQEAGEEQPPAAAAAAPAGGGETS